MKIPSPHLDLRAPLRFLTALFPVLLLAVFLAGCGGGTDSSEVRSLRGVVGEEESGGPAAGLMVTILESGDSTITSETGEFHLPLPSGVSHPTVQFESAGGFQARAVLEELPEGEIAVSARFSVSRVKNEAEVIEVTVDRPKQEKAPKDNGPATPTPEPTSAVTPTPSVTVTPAGEPTPTPRPTKEPKPTPTPSASPTPTASPTTTPTPSPTPEPTPNPACLYDLDGSGVVDAGDPNEAATQFQKGTLDDWNGDGVLNSNDLSAYLSLFIQYFGEICEQ